MASAFSCNPCGDLSETFFEVEAIHLLNFQSGENSFDFNFEALEENSLVERSKFVLGVQIDAIYFSDATPILEVRLITSALACSPEPPKPTELITDLTFTCDQDLKNSDGETLAAGTSLNDYFFKWNTTFSVSTLLFTGNWAPLEYGEHFFLSASPVNDTIPHQFTIEYELDSGNNFSATSSKVFLY